MTRASDTAKLLGAGATILDGTTISTADNTSQLTLTSTDADNNIGPQIDLRRDSGSPADGDVLGRVRWLMDDDAGNLVESAILQSNIEDASQGTVDAQIQLSTSVANTMRNRMMFKSTETVFNEDSIDLDFRIESDINSAAFRMDGANGNIFLNTDTDSSALITAYHHAGKAAGIAFQNSSSGVGTATGFEISMAGTGVAGLIGYVWNYENGDIRFATNNTEQMRIAADGAVSMPAVYNDTTGSGANVHISSSGGLLFRSTSSLKYKNTINDATHGLTELLTLRPVTYKGNNDGDIVFGGLIAEEVHDSGLTEFVQYNDDGEPDALAYGNMVSLCIKAIQELKAENTALTARITALES